MRRCARPKRPGGGGKGGGKRKKARDAALLKGLMQGDVGGGNREVWDEESTSPLVEFVRSLRPPEPLELAADDVLARGEAVFEAQCLDCHSGPRGSGLRAYAFYEVGTDDALADWGDVDGDGLLDDGSVLTGGVKSPRLVGLHARERFLHNGSVHSLEQLFCLTDRPETTEHGFGSGGHTFGCELAEGERRDLISYLRAH